MLSYTNVDIEMHQFEISHIKMKRVTVKKSRLRFAHLLKSYFIEFQSYST